MNTTICFKYTKLEACYFETSVNSVENRAGEQDSAGVLKDMNSWTMVLETSMPLEEDQEE